MPRIPNDVIKNQKAYKEKRKKEKKLTSLTTSVGPNFKMDRINKARLANINAIPDVSILLPPSSPGTAMGPDKNPSVTTEAELLTESGNMMLTEAGLNLITE